MKWPCLVLIVVFVLISGCAPRPDNAWHDLPTADALLLRMEQDRGRIASLDAAGQVGVRVNGRYLSSQQFISLQRPHFLRVDALTGFGQLVMQLASDGENLAVFLNDKVPGNYYYGSASYANIARFVRIPLAAQDLMALLLYDPPLTAYDESKVGIVERQLELTLSGGERRQVLTFNEQLQLTRCAYYRAEQLQLTVVYERIDSEESFPQRVRIELPQDQTKVTINYDDLTLNKVFAREHFNLKQPTGSNFHQLD